MNDSVDLICICPVLNREYEARVQRVARRFGRFVKVTNAKANELSRFTDERVFVSRSQPNLVVLRGGEVVAQAIGDLPARDLEMAVRSGAGRAA